LAIRSKKKPWWQRHAAILSEIATARRVGAISSDEMTAAMAREEAAFQRTTAALRAETAALAGNNAMSRRAIAQRTNLIFQLNDIGVSLVSGMNPLMVAVQQGSQIATIYGPEEGGIGAAFRETGKMAATAATKFAPLLVALGLAAGGIAGITHEINKNAKMQVGWGDVALGVLQTIGDGLMGVVRTLGDVFAPAFSAAYEFLKDMVHGNARSAGLPRIALGTGSRG
jgi:hypothetical protein